MKKPWLLANLALFWALAAFAQGAPETERIRGAITSFERGQLQVKTRDGRDVKFGVTDSTTVNVLEARKMSDIRQGSFVGVTAVQGGPGKSLRAIEVHIFPESQRGTGEGHYDWDLEPGATMTNANIEAAVDHRKNKELTLSYKGGSQTIIVPLGIPIVGIVPGDKSRLVAGAQVFIIAQRSADGTWAARRISVGKEGLRPPM